MRATHMLVKYAILLRTRSRACIHSGRTYVSIHMCARMCACREWVRMQTLPLRTLATARVSVNTHTAQNRTIQARFTESRSAARTQQRMPRPVYAGVIAGTNAPGLSEACPDGTNSIGVSNRQSSDAANNLRLTDKTLLTITHRV